MVRGKQAIVVGHLECDGARMQRRRLCRRHPRVELPIALGASSCCVAAAVGSVSAACPADTRGAARQRRYKFASFVAARASRRMCSRQSLSAVNSSGNTESATDRSSRVLGTWRTRGPALSAIARSSASDTFPHVIQTTWGGAPRRSTSCTKSSLGRADSATVARRRRGPACRSTDHYPQILHSFPLGFLRANADQLTGRSTDPCVWPYDKFKVLHREADAEPPLHCTALWSLHPSHRPRSPDERGTTATFRAGRAVWRVNARVLQQAYRKLWPVNLSEQATFRLARPAATDGQAPARDREESRERSCNLFYGRLAGTFARAAWTARAGCSKR